MVGKGKKPEPRAHFFGSKRWFAGLIAGMIAIGGTVAIGGSPVVDVAGATTVDATYESQGPGPITNGQTENLAPANDVAGAIHTVVAHPSDANILWAGSVNGGVWRTNNATAANPHWVPLTDQMPGLSIGALELDPTVATNTVLVAGLGRFSSFNGTGGPLVGLLRTADGGANWTALASTGLANENISGVAPRGNTIVVSSNSNTFFRGGPGLGGIFRSTNGGATFTRLSGNGATGLPSAFGTYDLVSDPSNNARLYTAGPAGIFRSTDTGATWTNVTNQVTGINTTTSPTNTATNNIELSVHNSGGNNVVYAGVINAGGLNGLWRSTDQGANWTQLDTPTTNETGTIIGLQPRGGQKPGGQGGTHFSIRSDPANPNIVYLGGDRQPQDPGPNNIPGDNDDTWPNSIGANNFTGRLFRCNASLAAGSQCLPITHNGTSNNSAPHADSREIVFDANGDIIETDDGGIVRQTDPTTANGVWQNVSGDMRVSEGHSCSYDNVGDIILCGNQDTGTPEQSATGSVTWNSLVVADGGFTNVNDIAGGASSVRFSSSNSLAQSRRRTCTAANVCATATPTYNVSGTGQNIFQNDPGLPLYPPVIMNKVDGTRLIVGTSRVYESTDSLDNLTIALNSMGVDGNGNPAVTTRAIAYGGRQSGADAPGVLWFGDNGGRLWLRTGGAGAPVQLPAWTFGNARDIVLDPENWATAYVTDGTSVYRTTDAGNTFTNISGSLTTEAPNAQVFSLEIVPIDGSSHYAVLAGTDTGVFMTQTQNLGVWAELGNNLPNAVVFDLNYDAIDDALLVSALGRGAWLLRDVSEAIPVADLRVTKSDSPDPVKAGQELFYTISVTNDGDAAAAGAVVTDELPDEVIYLSDNGGCTYNALQHRLTCPLGVVNPDQTVSFQIKTLVKSDTVVNEGDGTLNIVNTVTVGSASVDSNTANNTDSEITFVQDLADLKVTKLCKPDDQLPAGETGFCEIFVDNLGPSSARNVTLRDVNTSDGVFTFGAITTSQGTCAETPAASGIIECELGDLEAASTTAEGRATVRIEVSATEALDINDVADARSDTPDPNTANNQARDHISVMAVTDLSIDKTAAAGAVAGTDITYTLAIENDGPSTATGVVVKDDLGSGVEVVSVSGTGGAGCNAGTPGNPLLPTTCSFGTLAPGATRTMTINVHILPGTRGPLHNDARVSSTTFDDDLSNNLDSTTTQIAGEADLSITKSDSPDPVIAGQQLTYTIVVANAGPSTAFAVKINDPLPAGTTFVSGVDGNGATVCALVQPGIVSCDLGDMGPGTSKTVFLTVFVAASTPQGTVLSNTSTVSSTTTDPIPGNNSDTETTTVNTSAELWLDKQATQRSGNPSPIVTYTLVVHNNAGCETDAQSSPTPTCGAGGPSDAVNVVLTDTLPLDAKKMTVQFVSPQCTYTKTTHKVVCNTARIPAGATVTFVIEAQVQGSVGTITNTATITSSGTFDPVAGNNTNAASLVMKGGTGKTR